MKQSIQNQPTSPKKENKMCSTSSRKVKNCVAFICSKCKHINFPELFSEERPVLENGQYNDIILEHQSMDDLDPECALCRLLTVAWPGPALMPPHRLTTQSREDLREEDYRILRNGFSNSDPVGPRWLRISGRYPRMSASKLPWTHYDTFNSIMEASTNSLLDTRVDFRPLKAWIEYCCNKYDRECRVDSNWKPVKGMELIDVQNRCVVKATNNQVRYAALSYVWGIQDLNNETGDGFPAQLPRTIEDAIQATRELGLGYLWVDKYCIPQRNDKKKSHQIKNMDRIYQQAYVTIVAAAGDGPDHGLPGVSLPRVFPAHVLIDDRLFVGIPAHPLRGTLQQSRWNTRAWTYQEKVLSRRILYFTDSQVVFNCKRNSIGIEDPVHNYAHSEVRHLVNDSLYELRLKFKKQFMLANYEMDGHMRAVNERHITYEADRINTLAGILNSLKAEGIIMGHLSGIPIWKHHEGEDVQNPVCWESGFLSGLAWSFDNTEGRRSEFPSWSWVGWKGSYRTNETILNENVRIWFEIQPDDITSPILDDPGSQDTASLDQLLPQKRPPAEDLLPSAEFWPMLEGDGWKDSSCRFIHIEAPIVCFRCKKGNEHWHLASLEGHPIHEDTRVRVKILVIDDPELEESLASNTFRGLVLFSPDKEHIFVIVIRDLDCYSERIGSWRAKANLLHIPQVDMRNGSKELLRVDYRPRSEGTIDSDYEEITWRRREKIRLR